MLSISLDPEIERRLSELAKRAGKTEADYARELIEQDIEDLEDIRIAEARLATLGRTYTLEEAEKELGLDDKD
jgi:RHH-type rel operon transcriptional repressor/antitoxin RelB